MNFNTGERPCLRSAPAWPHWSASPALAYVGPGAGLTLLGALWGLILAVVMSVGFIVLWPFRRLMRRNKQDRLARETTGAAGDDDATHSMLANPSDDRDDRRHRDGPARSARAIVRLGRPQPARRLPPLARLILWAIVGARVARSLIYRWLSPQRRIAAAKAAAHGCAAAAQRP